MASIFQNAVAPYALSRIVESSDPAFDMTTATAGVFEVEREATSEIEEWAATLSDEGSSAGKTSVTLTHIYQEGDVPNLETLKIRAKVTLAGVDGPVYGKTFRLVVGRAFE